jgi:hypothetical protein
MAHDAESDSARTAGDDDDASGKVVGRCIGHWVSVVTVPRELCGVAASEWSLLVDVLSDEV